jgi:hypothetical protein
MTYYQVEALIHDYPDAGRVVILVNVEADRPSDALDVAMTTLGSRAWGATWEVNLHPQTPVAERTVP